SEVARQASSLVLLDDDLSAMVDAIEHGRRIHDNLRKAIRYIISIHLPILILVIFPLLAGWEFASLFSPVHIIFLELIMGPTCSIVFESEPSEEDLMRRPPSTFGGDLLSWRELRSSIFRGSVISIALLCLMYGVITAGWQEVQVRTAVFSALSFSNIFLTVSSRSDRFPMWISWYRRNPLSWMVIGLTLVVLAAALFWSPLTNVFELCRPSLSGLTLSFFVGLGSVIWWDFIKYLGRE
ncbi:MAG: cation transporting ATPase C-terminal domain-containing protein, partial [Flavobacteriales bacterium]